MAFLEKAGEAVVSSVTKTRVPLVGVGIAIAAPFVVPLLRPLAKGVIKSGFYVADKSRELVAEAGEQLGDLVAEARTEVRAPAEAASEAAAAAQA